MAATLLHQNTLGVETVTMIAQTSVILLAAFQLISAQGRGGPHHLPVQCQRPPQGVKEMPHECCKIPKFFKDTDFEECGFKKLEENEPPLMRGPPDCTKQTCMMEKYNLAKGEEVDYEALNKFMDKWAETNPAFKDSVSTAKERCIGKPLPGPPHECEANKIVFCVSAALFEECPKWEETDGCQKLKSHVNECAPYFNFKH